MRMNAKKKEKTRRETTAIKVWVTPAEKAAITVKADAYSLSASTYLRELALRSTRPPTRPGEKLTCGNLRACARGTTFVGIESSFGVPPSCLLLSRN